MKGAVTFRSVTSVKDTGSGKAGVAIKQVEKLVSQNKAMER